MVDYFAGGLSGLAQTLAGHPLDTLKVWSQDGITRPRTFKTLYRGVSYPLLTTGFLTSINYGVTQKLYQENQSYIISGFLSGVFTGILQAPVDYLKINSQIMNGKNGKNQISLETIKKYKGKIGWFSTISREAFGFPVYYESYYYCRDYLGYHSIIAGGISGLLSWTVTYPLDTVKTRIQSGESKTHMEGIKLGNLWSGYKYCAIRAVLTNSIGWLIYEFGIKACGEEDGSRGY